MCAAFMCSVNLEMVCFGSLVCMVRISSVTCGCFNIIYTLYVLLWNFESRHFVVSFCCGILNLAFLLLHLLLYHMSVSVAWYTFVTHELSDVVRVCVHT